MFQSTQDGCGRVRDSGEGAWTCVLNECCDSRGCEENGELMLELYGKRELGGVLEGNESWASRGRRLLRVLRQVVEYSIVIALGRVGLDRIILHFRSR